jgi:rhodanese-related sulfurtransferase/membrane protein YqaA with SNARE-associated domain
MDTLVAAITQHGYAILFTLVFMEAVGLPVPAAPVLLVAGAASANGPLHPASSLLAALAALVLGDGLMYLLGRRTGWWLLGILCRFSISPESCILRSADAFYKRGRAVLIFAKFVPGINALAAPLAGSMRMRLPQFLAFDLGYRFLLAFRERNRGPVIRIKAQEAARRLQGISIFDVRSHGYYEKNTMRIQGSVRLEPNALHQEVLQLPKDTEIVLYCTCVREATSVRVARVLKEQGYAVSVISGGLRAWKKAGLPLEPVPKDDIVQLPTFS